MSRVKGDGTKGTQQFKVAATELIAARNYDLPQARDYPVRPSAWVAHHTALPAEKVWGLKSNQVVRGTEKAL